MVGSYQYFNYLSDFWHKMPTNDFDRMSELWKGFEQVVAAAYQKFFEASFNATVENVFAYSDERWLPYTFNSDNYINKAASYTTNQDLSLGVNLSAKYLIKVSWDSGMPIEIDLRGTTPTNTKISEIVSLINIAAGFKLCKGIEDSILQFTSPTVGISSKITFHLPSVPILDASELVLGIGQSQMPYSVPEYPYCYSSPYPKIASIPVLQDAIREESVTKTLVEGADYYITLNEICFKVAPPESLWAKRNLFDEEWPWANFGFLMNIYQTNSERYVEVIKGLWFAFWTGPRPDNLRKTLYLLFGLPVAPYDGTIINLTLTEISVADDSGKVTVLEIPSGLEAEVVMGQRVVVFQPLVTGIQIYDKVNYPGFIAEQVGRYGIQRFLTENATRGPGPDTDETKALQMLEEYCFLPQILVDAFIKPDINLTNVRLFLDAIKPVVKTYLFQVIIGIFKDELGLGDLDGECLEMDITPSVDLNETTYQPVADLLANEASPLPGYNVDTEGALIEEKVEFVVTSFGLPIPYNPDPYA